MKVLLIGYEPSHAAPLAQCATRLRKEGHEVTIAAFDQELEWHLEKLQEPCLSARDYTDLHRSEHLTRAETLTQGLFDELDFLEYRGVPMRNVFSFHLQVYLQKFFYYGSLCDGLLERQQPDAVHIMAPGIYSALEENALVRHEAWAPVEGLVHVCAGRGLSPVVERAHSRERPREDHMLLRRMRQAAVSALFALAGAALVLLRRRPSVRVLASDYWATVGPLFEALPDSELILYDRKEAAHMPLYTIWRHRIRFLHATRPRRVAAHRAHQHHQQLLREWDSARASLNILQSPWYGAPLSRTLDSVLDDLMRYQVGKALVEVEAVYRFLEHLKPDVILLRTLFGQWHFPLLAAVARQLLIPAIELQHGLESFAPGSLSRRHPVAYTGVYGTLVRDEMLPFGYEAHGLPVIGSLRFDATYADAKRTVRKVADTVTLLCVAPDIFFNPLYDTYSAYAYFAAVADAARALPSAHVLIKLRPSAQRKQFFLDTIQRTFKGVSYDILQDEPLQALCAQADLVVSCYSTATLEVLLCAAPTIVFGLGGEEASTRFHFERYAQEEALRTAYNAEDLLRQVRQMAAAETQKELSAGAAAFMQKHYAFDGRAAARLAELIRTLVKK